MCGRYVLAEEPSSIKRRFHTSTVIKVEKKYNIAPSQSLPVVIREEEPKPHNETTLMRWGLIPHWAKDNNIGYSMINARSETLMEKPSFKVPFEKRRCLVPASGFYEWKREDDKKIPYYIHLQHEDVFAFAGLYETWIDPTSKKTVYSYTIITTEPNSLMAHIHDRMPVILPKDEEDVWLDPNTSTNELRVLLRPYPAKEMEAYPISSDVNRPINDYADLLKPVQLS